MKEQFIKELFQELEEENFYSSSGDNHIDSCFMISVFMISLCDG